MIFFIKRIFGIHKHVSRLKSYDLKISGLVFFFTHTITPLSLEEGVGGLAVVIGRLAEFDKFLVVVGVKQTLDIIHD